MRILISKMLELVDEPWWNHFNFFVFTGFAVCKFVDDYQLSDAPWVSW